ncbi:MAG TPA: hypothetical protein VMR88_08675 [Candidatus Polarisedimenticolaceae bacterium]|nr:hypothetical protein [Candidatus Polarisedimenticolaceae bacterium]
MDRFDAVERNGGQAVDFPGRARDSVGSGGGLGKLQGNAKLT